MVPQAQVLRCPILILLRVRMLLPLSLQMFSEPYVHLPTLLLLETNPAFAIFHLFDQLNHRFNKDLTLEDRKLVYEKAMEVQTLYNNVNNTIDSISFFQKSLKEDTVAYKKNKNAQLFNDDLQKAPPPVEPCTPWFNPGRAVGRDNDLVRSPSHGVR